jgi:hypothetical protein
MGIYLYMGVDGVFALTLIQRPMCAQCRIYACLLP